MAIFIKIYKFKSQHFFIKCIFFFLILKNTTREELLEYMLLFPFSELIYSNFNHLLVQKY